MVHPDELRFLEAKMQNELGILPHSVEVPDLELSWLLSETEGAHGIVVVVARQNTESNLAVKPASSNARQVEREDLTKEAKHHSHQSVLSPSAVWGILFGHRYCEVGLGHQQSNEKSKQSCYCEILPNNIAETLESTRENICCGWLVPSLD